MTLSAGTRLGTYEILAPIGAGGMGEVYRARDTQLDRTVAIKILPDSFAADPDRLMRFTREAKTLASLNHPNIAAIHGIEGGALVMELVDGEDLSAHIARGPMPVADALPIAKQIAEALEAAHGAGIIHRDLKPANIKVRDDGTVKVLDFGLAKALDPAGASPADALKSPTMTSPALTAMGLILGTAAYMAPEQARGKAADRRADIWAFGVVLYEMLSGTTLFPGDTVSDVLAGVLKTDVNPGTLPKSTPPALRRLLRWCLERNPKNRLHDIADARILLDELLAGRSDADDAVAAVRMPGPLWRRALPWAIGALGLTVGLGSLALRSADPGAQARDLSIVRFAIPLPADAPLYVESYPGRSLALSPDGAQVAYTTANAPDIRIRLRRFDDGEIHSIPGTERGRAPFFSPDGEWLAYFDWSESALKKVSVRGGKPVTLQRGFANAGWMLGTWCDDGRIVFDTWNGGLRVVGGEGSGLRALTKPTDEWHLDPQTLPGGCRVLFYTHRAEGQTIEALSADGGARTRILENASHGRYIASGHLLFIRDGALHVVPFDPKRLQVSGEAIPLPVDAAPDWYNGSAPNPQLAVSRAGTLVYAPADEAAGRGSPLLAVTHDGTVEELAALPFLYPTLSLAPDGEELAISGRRAGGARIEALHLRRKATSTLAELGPVDMPGQAVWTPDRKAVLYTRYGPSAGELVRHVLDGSVPDQVLHRLPGTWHCPWSISPDGRWLVLSRYNPETQADLLLVDLTAAPGTGAAVTPLIATPDEENGAAISPDGEWFAYMSNKGAGVEIFIEKFPRGGQKTRVSTASGPPVWSPDGRTLYFTSTAPGGRALDMMVARVEFTPALRVGETRRLFSGPFARGNDMGRTFGLGPDGRFLMVGLLPGAPVSSGTGSAPQLLVVQNWFEDLRRILGARSP